VHFLLKVCVTGLRLIWSALDPIRFPGYLGLLPPPTTCSTRSKSPCARRPTLTVRLSRIMRRFGWANIRARGLNPGSYRDRVRGYAREVPGHPATLRAPNEF
jgi:hypothetical protein